MSPWASCIESVWQDLRYGWRSLWRTPAFALTVTVTIALGLGVNTALFTLFNANYLRPLPVRNPHSLYEVFWIERSGRAQDFSWPEYQEFLAQNSGFSEALAFLRAEARVDGQHVSGVLVSSSYFSMLGIKPAVGRTLLPADVAAPGGEPVITISHSVWQNLYGGAPDIVGKKVLLRGREFEIVGVMGPEFNGLGARPTDFWAPLTMASVFDPGTDVFGATRPRVLGIVGLLKPGFSLRRAEAGIALWAQRFTADLPAAEQAMAASSVSRATRNPFNPKNAAIFSLVLAAFAVILVIACANVVNMMLARAVSRQREIGVRLSLGASRGRLIRQLLTESVLVVLPAAALAMVLSQAIVRGCLWLLMTTLPPGIAGVMNRIPHLPLDVRVFGFSLTAAFLAAVLSGLAPALQASRTDLTQGTRGDFGNDWRPSRLRNGLLAGQVLVCVVMLILAGVLLRAIKGLQALDATLSTREVIELVVREGSRAAILQRLTGVPNLQTLAAASSAPVDRKPFVTAKPASGIIVTSAANRVSPEYFAMFDIPVLRGRGFTTEDARSAAPVALVSQTAAAEIWTNEDPVGKSLDLSLGDNTAGLFNGLRTVVVIGVVRDEASRWVSNGESKRLLYFPANPRTAGTRLLLAMHDDSQSAIRQLDANLGMSDPNAVEEIHALQIRRWVIEEAYSFRVIYWMASGLGLLALLLTLSGIYGVVSYAVWQRTKEIGIRMTLGATPESVVALVLRQSMRLAVIGGAAGCTLALAVSKLLASTLVMINTFDLAAYAGGVLMVSLACATAAYLPARRATRIDPIISLRYD